MASSIHEKSFNPRMKSFQFSMCIIRCVKSKSTLFFLIRIYGNNLAVIRHGPILNVFLVADRLSVLLQ